MFFLRCGLFGRFRPSPGPRRQLCARSPPEERRSTAFTSDKATCSSERIPWKRGKIDRDREIRAASRTISGRQLFSTRPSSRSWKPLPPPGLLGRGASANPANRFEALVIEPDPEERLDEEVPALTTKFYRDFSRTIIAHNDSPDVGFESSVNPYRGCEHGCIYCYARPTHEYLGFSAGLDFESRIMVKEDAPELLAAELSSPRWKPQTLVMSGVTDPYQPVERRLKLTRRCLEVLARFRNPVAIITKNQLVTRDADLLGELAAHHAAAVNISVTSLDPKLQRILEPRTSTRGRGWTRSPTAQGGRAGRRDGRADHSRPHGSRSAGDPASLRQRGRAIRRLHRR